MMWVDDSWIRNLDQHDDFSRKLFWSRKSLTIHSNVFLKFNKLPLNNNYTSNIIPWLLNFSQNKNGGKKIRKLRILFFRVNMRVILSVQRVCVSSNAYIIFMWVIQQGILVVLFMDEWWLWVFTFIMNGHVPVWLYISWEYDLWYMKFSWVRMVNWTVWFYYLGSECCGFLSFEDVKEWV